MDKRFFIIAIIISGCTLAVVWYLAESTRGSVTGESKEASSAVSHETTYLTSIQGASIDRVNQQDRAEDPELVIDNDDERFLDVMRPFLPEKYQKIFEKAEAEGRQWAPKTFSEMADGAELVGHIANSGKLMEFYRELQKAAEDNPSNVNLLRMMVLVTSFQGFPGEEHAKNLSRLAVLDSHADVVLPFAQMLSEQGNFEAAYSWLQKSAAVHPEQAAGTFTSALPFFADVAAAEQKSLVVDHLKGMELTASQADRCGGYMYDADDIDDAIYFYKQNANRENNPFFREVAQVRLCEIQIAKGRQDEKTIATLKELALHSPTPAIKIEASRSLASIGIELSDENNTSNANTPQEPSTGAMP